LPLGISLLGHTAFVVTIVAFSTSWVLALLTILEEATSVVVFVRTVVPVSIVLEADKPGTVAVVSDVDSC
jgi:hypothetical protein